ncbi:MAG TPA: signal peptidase I [Candidatus Omnitrophota bacterium]|nr:signal peptidase I [Candidatus Omnitrophota bacterium]
MKIVLKNWNYWWYEWVKPILVAAVLAMFIRTFIMQPFKIPSSSMVPTFVPGDRIFVNKFVYGAKIPFTKMRLPALQKPRQGDIIVFFSPEEKKKFLVKRFIASGGQTVEIRDGDILIDGKPSSAKALEKFYYHNTGEYGPEGRAVEVPEGSFYVLGDNSANSMDSRYWGFVPEDNIVGKAFIIHWPPKRIRLISEE